MIKEKIILPSVYVVLPDQENLIKTNILIDKSTHKIEKIFTNISSHEYELADVLSVFENKIVLPGFIDPHVHFRTPGNEEAENWESASKASLFAGITTVLDMPNTNPSTTDEEGYRIKKEAIQKQSKINFGLYGGLTKNNLEELLAEKKYKAIKIYMASTTGDLLLEDISSLENISSQYWVNNKIVKPFCFHSEEESIIQKNEKSIALEKPEDHSQIRSEEAAIESTKKIVDLYAKMQKKNKDLDFHVCHVSTIEEADMLLENNMSFEVAPHHIFLNTSDYKKQGYLIKCNPPVRQKETADKLLKLLLDRVGNYHLQVGFLLFK